MRINKTLQTLVAIPEKSEILENLLERFNKVDFLPLVNTGHANDRVQFMKVNLTRKPELKLERWGNERRKQVYDGQMMIWKHKNNEAKKQLRILHGATVSLIQYTDSSVALIIEKIKEAHLIICEGKNSMFLYDGIWEEVSKKYFADFLTRATKKMGTPSLDEDELMKLFLQRVKLFTGHELQYLDDESDITELIRERVKNK